MNLNRAIVLRSRPIGAPRAADFSLIEQPIPVPNAGSLLVRVHECSLDPAMRRWMDADSYGTPIALDDPLPCTLIGRVVESRCTDFNAGDFVTGRGTLSDFALLHDDGYTRRIDQVGLPSLTCHLSVLGTSGLTAYNGLLKVGQPAAGETVLVSAASGSVGSLVGQIASIHGCRVVGITGGAMKCSRLLESYGFDAAIDRLGKDADALAHEARLACGQGVDVYFDNAGGPCLEAALAVINRHARIVLCGMIGEYNVERAPPGPRNLWQLVAKTATMTGFLNREHLAHATAELAQLRRWIEQGRLKWSEHIEEGLENFHTAFMRLFDGTHDGKMILRIAPDA